MNAVTLQGTAAALDVEDVLDLLDASGVTGTLVVHGQGGSGRIAVAGGSVRAIEVDGHPALDILVERSAVILGVAVEDRQLPVLADLLGLLVARTDRYVFESNESIESGMVTDLAAAGPAGWALVDLRIELAAQRLVERALSASLGDRTTVSLCSLLPDGTALASADRAGWWVVARAATGPSLAELAEASGLTRPELRTAVLDLAAAGIVLLERPRLELVVREGGVGKCPALPAPTHPAWARLEAAVFAEPPVREASVEPTAIAEAPGLDAAIEALRPLRGLDPDARDPWRQRRRQRRAATG